MMDCLIIVTAPKVRKWLQSPRHHILTEWKSTARKLGKAEAERLVAAYKALGFPYNYEIVSPEREL